MPRRMVYVAQDGARMVAELPRGASSRKMRCLLHQLLIDGDDAEATQSLTLSEVELLSRLAGFALDHQRKGADNAVQG